MSHVVAKLTELTPKNFPLWFLLAFQSGGVNGLCFVNVGIFVTHTTGFATTFGFDLSEGNYYNAIGALLVPIYFLCGGMFSSYFIDLPLKEQRVPNYYLPLSLITACLLVAFGINEIRIHSALGSQFKPLENYFFVAFLAMASGTQNCLLVSTVAIRTTHLTGVTSELASSLVRYIFGKHKIHEESKNGLYALTKIGIIGSFILGSTICTLLFVQVPEAGMIIPILTSLYCFIVFTRMIRSPKVG